MILLLKNIMTVFRFEWAQAVRPTKIAWWSALALFPPLVVSLIILSSRGGPAIPRMLWPGLIAPLVVGVVSTMEFSFGRRPRSTLNLKVSTGPIFLFDHTALLRFCLASTWSPWPGRCLQPWLD